VTRPPADRAVNGLALPVTAQFKQQLNALMGSGYGGLNQRFLKAYIGKLPVLTSCAPEKM